METEAIKNETGSKPYMLFVDAVTQRHSANDERKCAE